MRNSSIAGEYKKAWRPNKSLSPLSSIALQVTIPFLGRDLQRQEIVYVPWLRKSGFLLYLQGKVGGVATLYQQWVTASLLIPCWGLQEHRPSFTRVSHPPALDRSHQHAASIVLMSRCKDVGCSCFHLLSHQRKWIIIFNNSTLSNSESLFSRELI